MKCVVQRVSSASVSVNKQVISKIDKGLLILVGVKERDSKKDAEFLAEKLVKLRVMSDPPSPKASEGQAKNGKMNLAVNDVGGEMLVVSQFTLYADTSGGNRPSFVKAARPEVAQPLYEYFVNQLSAKIKNLGESATMPKALGGKVQTGKFGEYMEIETVLDGPVTIIMET